MTPANLPVRHAGHQQTSSSDLEPRERLGKRVNGDGHEATRGTKHSTSDACDRTLLLPPVPAPSFMSWPSRMRPGQVWWALVRGIVAPSAARGVGGVPDELRRRRDAPSGREPRYGEQCEMGDATTRMVLWLLSLFSPGRRSRQPEGPAVGTRNTQMRPSCAIRDHRASMRWPRSTMRSPLSTPMPQLAVLRLISSMAAILVAVVLVHEHREPIGACAMR